MPLNRRVWQDSNKIIVFHIQHNNLNTGCWNHIHSVDPTTVLSLALSNAACSIQVSASEGGGKAPLFVLQPRNLGINARNIGGKRLLSSLLFYQFVTISGPDRPLRTFITTTAWVSTTFLLQSSVHFHPLRIRKPHHTRKACLPPHDRKV